MPDVSAVNVSPTWAVPLMVGAPVAGLFAACCDVAGIRICAGEDASPASPRKSIVVTRYTYSTPASTSVSV